MLNLSKKKFDIIIIGAGLSGLILANEISRKSKRPKHHRQIETL